MPQQCRGYPFCNDGNDLCTDRLRLWESWTAPTATKDWLYWSSTWESRRPRNQTKLWYDVSTKLDLDKRFEEREGQTCFVSLCVELHHCNRGPAAALIVYRLIMFKPSKRRPFMPQVRLFHQEEVCARWPPNALPHSRTRQEQNLL